MKYFIVLSRNFVKGIALFFATWSSLHVLSRTYETFVLFCKRGKQAWGARRQHVCHVVKQLSRYLKTCETCKLSNALSSKPLACLWYATKIPSSSFWHLLYNNLHWKISKWSEIISWCIFAQSRLYAFLKKQFPEITTIACRTKIPCVCVLKICIELYLLPSSPRLLYFRCSKVPILIEI